MEEDDYEDLQTFQHLLQQQPREHQGYIVDIFRRPQNWDK